MGCISSKEFSLRERPSRKGSLDRRVAHVNSSRREEGVRSKDNLDGTDVKAMLIDKKTNGSSRLLNDQNEKKKLENRVERKRVQNYEYSAISLPNIEIKKIEKLDAPVISHPSQGILPNSLEAEQVAAGWPSWLALAAGEAIKGWVPQRASTFEKLDRIGQGTYSNVYRARDVTHDKIVALKKVRFDNKDVESVKFMAREILILRRLDHPNIIKLEGLIASHTSSSLYLVFEYMEHDLTGLASLPGINFSEAQIKCYMRQLLSGLDYCHSRSVLHRDIKGSNLLIDNNGILKIADFGLASFFDPRSSSQLTSRVVTLWYRAPELLLGASKYGVAVDLWSAGCILGELYTGKPILPGRTEVEQLHKIFKLCGSPSEDYWRKAKLPHSSVIKPQRPYKRCVAETFKDFRAPAIGLMEALLSMDPVHRGTAAIALKSEVNRLTLTILDGGELFFLARMSKLESLVDRSIRYFTTKPYACDPSSLPQYPPSKEMDAKMRDEEARRQGRQGTVGINGSGSKDAPVALESQRNPDRATSTQRRRPSNSNIRGETFNSHKEQTVSGFLIGQSKQSQAVREGNIASLEQQRRNVSHSGPLVHGTVWTKAVKEPKDTHQATGRTNPSTPSGLVVTKTPLLEDSQEMPVPSQPDVPKQVGSLRGFLNGSRSTTKTDKKYPLRKLPDSPPSQCDKSGTRDPNLYGRGPRGNKIYVSGPLLVPSNNVEQMLKEHDRKIQEFARQRLDKTKLEKMNAQGK